ncbi:hypothetical protein D770_15125 [Flammeovirgaceae bacterium 311]|nr:hypothetical protein D770_15125 [Flammeovirgaceae bacterium 311]
MNTYHIAHKIANAISVICFLLLFVTGLDLVLPRVTVQETIQGKWQEVYSVKGKHSVRKEIKNDDREFLVTENHEFTVDYIQNFSCKPGDLVQISTTPLFGFVREVHKAKHGEMKLFKRRSSLLGNYIFLPYALLFTSVIGLINYKDSQQAINFGSGSLVLLVLILWMMKVF